MIRNVILFCKVYLAVFCSEIILIVAGTFFFYGSVSPLNLVNAIGLIGLISLTCGLILFIIQGGFFDAILYSFKRVHRSFRKNRLGEAEAEAPLTELKIRNGSRGKLTYPLIVNGLLLFLLSLFSSIF